MTLGTGDAELELLQGKNIKWVDTDGNLVGEPSWFRPMFALYLVYGFQNTYANSNSHGDHLERMHDEYVLLKLVLDAYAGQLSSNAICGETFGAMVGECEGLRLIQKDFNRDVKTGLLISRRNDWARKLDECHAGCGEYNYMKVRCDFDDAMRSAINQMRRQLLSDKPQCVEIVKRYTPFRYPGTQIAYDIM